MLDKIHMLNGILQTSCSELLCDTDIHDPKVAYERFSNIFRRYKLTSEPVLSLRLLEDLKYTSLYANNYNNSDVYEEYDLALNDIPEILVYDGKGNRAYLQYGHNGYLETGYRLDSDCNHGDESCYPIFRVFEIEGGTMIACDGGSTYYYEHWLEDLQKLARNASEE